MSKTVSLLLLFLSLFCISQTNTVNSKEIDSRINSPVESITIDTEEISYQIYPSSEIEEMRKNFLQEGMKNKQLGDYDIFWYDERTSYSPSTIIYPNANGTYTLFEIDFNHQESQLVNLDTIGKPELIIYSQACEYGSGGGRCQTFISVINTDSIPYFVMNELISCQEEGFSRVYGLESEPTPYILEVSKRSVAITNQLICIGELEFEDNDNIREFESEVSLIPSGKYFMHNGQLQLMRP